MHTPLKPVILSVSLIILVVAGASYALTKNASESADVSATPTATPSPSPTQSSENQADVTAASGTYVDYRPGIIEQTSGTKVLFFHAPWCPQCRALESSIKAGTIPANTTIIKVDYDSNQALRKTYGVTLQTSLVRLDESGELVKKYVAYDDPSLEALTKNLL